MARRAVRAGLIAVLAAGVLDAQEPRVPQFRSERAVVTASGPQRLAIDVPLLVGSLPFTTTVRAAERGERRTIGAGGLGDLRFYDAAGREVPYLLVWPAPAETWTRGRVLGVRPIETQESGRVIARSSGFEADFGAPARMDRVRIEGLTPPFLKRVTLEGSGDRAHWTVLVAQGTVFHLPDENLEQTSLAFTPGPYRYVRATWDDTNSAVMPLPPGVSARVLNVRDAPPPALTATFPAARLPSEPGRSHYRITLPGPKLPIASIEPETGAAYVFRDAAVSESRLNSGSQLVPATLGRSQLKRVVRDELSASSLAIPISAPAEPEIDLVIADGDNAPLAVTRVIARFAELPWIYLESPGGPLVARWGDPGLRAPKYDLEAARASIAIGTVPEARWGEGRPLTPSPPASAPSPMPNVGAPIEVDRFRYARAIGPGDPGLIGIPLDAAVLAHSTGIRTAFADLRVADANGRQVPYLLERRDEPLSIPLAIERRDAPRSPRSTSPGVRSYYRLRLPYADLPPWRLALKTDVTIFDRPVTLGVERQADAQHRDPWTRIVAEGRWVHTDREKPAPELVLAAQGVDATDLLLVVDEGDNSPLPIGAARVLLPSYRVRLFRDPGAALRIVYGRDDIGPPSYDLALIAPTVLGAPVREVALEAEPPLAAGGPSIAIGSPKVFWSVLIVAVLVLLGLMVRLIKRQA